MTVVTVTYFNEPERMAAANAVEAKFVALANEFGLAIDKCVWNLDMGMNHSGPHRLDVHFEDYVLRVYFTDRELAEYWGSQEVAFTDNRLRELVENLHDIILSINAPEFSEYSPLGITSTPLRSDGHPVQKLRSRRRVK